MSNHLDFIVIGAQKSGTTALHEYLRLHPELYLPPAKEVPFFSHDPVYRQGWDHWFQRAFPEDRDGAIRGKITPHYMAGAPYAERIAGTKHDDAPAEEVIPRRIQELLPEVRLIALLRDPVERCISHHRMTTLLGWEDRTLELAVEQLLEPSTLAQARLEPNQLNGYLVWGEYARILKPYYRLFGSDAITVYFTSELDRQPGDVVQSIFELLDIDPTFVPPNVGRRYYEGATTRRIAWLDLYKLQKGAAASHATRAAWHLLPHPVRRRTAIFYEMAHYKVRMWNRVHDSEHETFDDALISQIRKHFQPDAEDLVALTGREPPWVAGPPAAVS
jgi:hypothetical protein